MQVCHDWDYRYWPKRCVLFRASVSELAGKVGQIPHSIPVTHPTTPTNNKPQSSEVYMYVDRCVHGWCIQTKCGEKKAVFEGHERKGREREREGEGEGERGRGRGRGKEGGRERDYLNFLCPTVPCCHSSKLAKCHPGTSLSHTHTHTHLHLLNSSPQLTIILFSSLLKEIYNIIILTIKSYY